MLLGSLLLFSLGSGAARYLGNLINWNTFLLGLLWILLVQLGMNYLNEYFGERPTLPEHRQGPLSGGLGVSGRGKLPRIVLLAAAFTAYAIAASLTVLLIQQPGVRVAALVFMLVIFLGTFFLVVPPARLVNSGYGEIVAAILLSNLVPAVAFLFQTGELHRLLAMVTFPLTFLQLSMILSHELPDYAGDLKYDHQNLLVRAGWETGMRLHNIFLLLAYMILGLAAAFGLPFSIALPGFLTFPLAIFQVWYMQRIASGVKPNWRVLLFVATVIYGLTAYLITFALWTR
jgi:1,4-dihydroxy-2-naphthoate octaprenyltransferase